MKRNVKQDNLIIMTMAMLLVIAIGLSWTLYNIVNDSPIKKEQNVDNNKR